MMSPDLRTAEDRRAFDPDKHFMGTLCRKGHDDGGGQSARLRSQGNCVTCLRQSAKEWRERNPERAAANTRRRDAGRDKRNRRQVWPIATHVGNARGRARSEGLPFNITADSMKVVWRDQAGLCFWTGRAIDFSAGSDRDPFRPSLDRLVPAGGYVDGNVVWSSNFANRARGDMPYLAFAMLMEELGFSGPFKERL